MRGKNEEDNLCYRELSDLRVYAAVADECEISGTSTFWTLRGKASWQKTDTISGKAEAIATVALDLPKFNDKSFAKVLATVSYRADLKILQTPLPTTCLTAEETVDGSCALNHISDIPRTVLSLKSVAVEKTVAIDIVDNPGRAAGVLKFLNRMDFHEISDDIYMVNASGTLMHCLIEILPSSEEEALLKIFSRSTTQMSVILRLLRDEFAGIIEKESDKGLDAVMALIEEIESYIEGRSSLEKERARLKSDLLISEM